jgi:lysophospholipase L1-like esterase
LRVVALGDSVVAGAACGCRPYPELFGDELAAGVSVPVTTVNLGASGQTTADVVSELAPGGDAVGPISQADVVLVSVGANDLSPALDAWATGGCEPACQAPLLADLQVGMARVLSGIRADLGGRRADILVTTYWNVFLDGRVARDTMSAGYLPWSETLTDLANAAICDAATFAGATCVDLVHVFKGTDGIADPTPLLADDGDHPDAAGQAAIAQALLSAAPTLWGTAPSMSPTR